MNLIPTNTRIYRLGGGLLILLLLPIATIHADAAHSQVDDGWRRTAHGWENRRAWEVEPPPSPQKIVRVHRPCEEPIQLALGEMLISLMVLIAFDGPPSRSVNS